MRNPLSKTITEIQPSGIRKFFDLVGTMDNAISLGVGEPDFETPGDIRNDAVRSLLDGRTFYTDDSGLPELRHEIARYIAKKYNLHYDFEREILVTVGGSEAIDDCLRVMLNPGEEVIIPQPSYVSYEPCTILAKGRPVIVKLQEKDDFRLTRQELENAITGKTKVLILPFPNNPTGAVMHEADLEAIADVVKRHDLFVLTDEIYSELCYRDDYCTIAALPGMKERTVYINGFSKTFAMTGWRLGYACAPENIMREMKKVHQFAVRCAPTTSQYAALTALRSCEADVADMKREYNERRQFLLARFKEMKLQCFEPFGAFYIFPSIQEFGLTSDEFATRLLQEKKVAVVPGTAFGASGEGFIRISYAYSMEKLEEAVKRIEEFISSLRGKQKPLSIKAWNKKYYSMKENRVETQTKDPEISMTK